MITGRHSIGILWRGRPGDLPALKFTASALTAAGHQLMFICGSASEGEVQEMEAAGLSVATLGVSSTGYEDPLHKVVHALRFRRGAWGAIEQMQAPALWVANAETAIVLGSRLLNYPFVLHTFELPEAKMKRKLATPYFRAARRVICSQRSRAEILREWFDLSRMPDVVPNVQAMTATDARQPLGDVAMMRTMAGVAAKRHIALYQGMISADRDLTGIARAIETHADRWALVVLGADYGHLSNVRRANPAVIHIPYIAPPDHLRVTSWATVGIVTYTPDSLNNAYCAPNKVYEYGAFGLPILANDIPGLRDTVKASGAGICCDTSDPRRVIEALEALVAGGEEFGRGARALYREAASDGTAVECAAALFE